MSSLSRIDLIEDHFRDMQELRLKQNLVPASSESWWMLERQRWNHASAIDALAEDEGQTSTAALNGHRRGW